MVAQARVNVHETRGIYLLKVVKNSGHLLIHSIIFFSIFLIAESVSLSCSSGLKEFEIL